MKRIRALALSLALLMLLGVLPVFPNIAQAGDTYSSSKYWIGVDTVNHRLTVYRVSDNKMVYRWLCSTGRTGYETPTGVYSLSTTKGDDRKSWCDMSGRKARYAVRINDNLFIHSVLYNDKKENTLRTDSVLMLGRAGTQGNVMVEFPHAKWLSMNCPQGTTVVIHEGVDDPLITKRLKNDAQTDLTASLKEPPDPDSISIKGGDFKLDIGQTKQLSVSFKPSDSEGSVEWESNKTKYATVNGDGVVKAVAEGEAKITAKTTNGKKATVKVTVVDPTKPTGVSLSYKGSYKKDGDRIIVDKNTGLQLYATLSPSTARSDLEWKSTNTKRATVNGSGWVTTKDNEGKFEIEVKTKREGKKAELKFKLVDSTKPTGVSLSYDGSYEKDGDRLLIKKGTGIQLRATLSPSTAQSGLEWKSTNTKRATVNGSGWVSVKDEGDFEIEVKTSREGKKAKLKFKGIDKPKKVSIKNDKDIKVGQSVQLRAEVDPKGTGTSLTWSSSDTGIATVDSSGKVYGKKKGKVTIKVRTGNGKEDTVKIKVK